MSLRSRLGRLENRLPSPAPETLCPVILLERAQIMLVVYRHLGPERFPDEVNQLADAFALQPSEESGERFWQAIDPVFEAQRQERGWREPEALQP